MVADSKGEVVEPWSIASDNELEDHAETAYGWGQVDLEALGKLGSVATLWVAGP